MADKKKTVKPDKKKTTVKPDRKKANVEKNRLDVKLSEHTPFQIVEAYKAMRTNLFYSLAACERKSVVFSSPLPSEGKSTTCSNLAIAMAQTGAKVLIIDADMRKPTLHHIFKVDNRKGLSGLLAGLDSMEEVFKTEVEPCLDVITSGLIPPNPSELLGSGKMTAFLKASSENYDYIFIDSPPINVVTDAIVLGSKTAGMVVVAQQARTTYDELNKAVDSIEMAGINILGLVMTQVRHKYGGGYMRGYKYKYKYRYGYGES